MDEIRVDANGLMLRPRRVDGCVRRRAAEMALPAVKRWMGRDTGDRSDADLMKDLEKHIGGYDGYNIAKALDGEGWGSDPELVEIMDGDFIDDAEREMTRQWVKCLGIKLDLPIGATVQHREDSGAVVRRDEELAQYGVRLPRHKENQWAVFNAEDVKLVAEEKAA